MEGSILWKNMKRFLIFTAIFTFAFPAMALPKQSHDVAMLSGYFQQPASQYYHLYYGAQYTYRWTKKKIYFRGAYAERPKFEAQGYIDQESTVYTLVGTTVIDKKWYMLDGFVGFGQFMGFIEPASAEDETSYNTRRTYRLNGIHAAMEIKAYKGPVYAALGHEIFIGYVDNFQLEAYVAWPVHYFNFKLGFLF